MIRDIADLLQALSQSEIAAMEGLEVTHPPTIGEMYEGLTAELLGKAIPPHLNLKIESGFIRGISGNLSPQVDCMLVTGQPEEIPHTSGVICEIHDVIAIIEVKKNLYSAEYRDSFEKLRFAWTEYVDYIQKYPDREPQSLRPANLAFQRLTGTVLERGIRIEDLAPELQLLFMTISTEQIAPLRIAFGYNGYASESGFRNGFEEFMKGNIGENGYGPASIPHLSVSGNYSLVKLNGFPYQPMMRDGWWPIVASTSANPILLLLEVLWTRLARFGGRTIAFWGDDLEVEHMRACLDVKPTVVEDTMGWEIATGPPLEPTAEDDPHFVDWTPEFVSEDQFIVFNLLCRVERIPLDDPGLVQFAEQSSQDVQAFVDGLRETGLVGVGETEIGLLTEECACVILPDGRFAVAENNTGRLMRWLANQTFRAKLQDE